MVAPSRFGQRVPLARGGGGMRFGVGLFSLQCTAMQPRHWTGAYRDMRELASLMEELGYDELWLSEHHFFYDGYCPALLPAAASVLSVTQRLRVGTGMLLLPMYDPARLAAVATDLAERSGGRLDLGVGMGYRDVEFDGHGVSRKQRLPRMVSGLEVLERAETAGGPPIWMGAQLIDPVKRAGQRGHPILFSAALPFERCKTLTKVWEEGWVEAGRPLASKPALGALRNIWLTEDPRARGTGCAPATCSTPGSGGRCLRWVSTSRLTSRRKQTRRSRTRWRPPSRA